MVDFNAVARHYQERVNAKAYYDDPVMWARERMNVYLWSKQQEILHSLAVNKKTAVKTTHSIGKMLPLDTPIPTPSGWTTMGDLAVGDEVLGQDGKPTKVVYTSPVQRGKMYEFTFNDGTSVVSCADHQWNTLTMTDRQRAKRYRNVGADWRLYWGESRTRTTQQIVDTLLTTGGQPNHLIPVTEALDLPDADLPIDPYIFGTWLGDGTSIRAEMTIGDDGQHIIARFAARGYELVRSTYDPTRYSFAASQGRGVFLRVIRDLGVYHNKHIPTMYLRASEAQRREVLAGILDTDGFVVNTGSVGIDLADERLANDVAELVRSLGYKVNVRAGRMTLSGRDCGMRYRLAFTPDRNPFTEGSHKHRDFRPVTSTVSIARATARTIVGAREVEEVDSKCITVDNERSLYLAGEHFIVTHNTFTAGLASSWWIDTRGTGGIVISSAPTYDQVHGLLWEEIRKFHVVGGLPGRVTQDDRWIMPFSEGGRSVDRLVAQGRKPADTNIHAFQGTHRPEGVLVILDEAGGVPESIYTGTEAITTAPMDRILAIGNPDDPNTEFGRIFREAPEDWNLITVSAFDTPNFTGEEVPEYLARSLPQREWVESRRKDWGEDSNRYKSKVLAEFPDTSDDGLFNMGLVEAAVRSVNIAKPKGAAPSLGVDVARFGTDRTTVVANWGGHTAVVDDWQGLDTHDTAERVAGIAERLGARDIRIDAIGVGAGVKDNLVRMVSEHCPVYEMIGNAASPDFNKWYNARAYWYDMLRSRIAAGEIDLPEHNQLVDEFRVIRYTLRDTSMLIESKEDMRRRGNKSPDFLDALIYATADIDGISGMDTDQVLGEEELLGDDWDMDYNGLEPWQFAPV